MIATGTHGYAKQEASSGAFWKTVDAVLVLNMDSAHDRMERFMSEWGQVIPEHKLIRLSAVVGRELPGFGQKPWFTERTASRSNMWAGIAGCALSHAKAIRYAREHCFGKVLILEDDASKVTNEPTAWSVAAEAVRRMSERSMLYLGYHRPVPFGRRISSDRGYDVWKTEGVLTTHAYVMSAGLYDTALEYLPTEDRAWCWTAYYRAVDTMYRSYLCARRDVDTYALYPCLVHQMRGKSAIGGDITGGEELLCPSSPKSYYSLSGICHLLGTPLRTSQIRLDSLTRLLHSRFCGFSGPRRKR